MNGKGFHKDCYFCGDEGYISSDFDLYKNRIETKVTIKKHHEGWPGIPHGGVGMTSMLEFADILDNITDNYPIRAEFRFGGDSILLGDDILISVEKRDGKYLGLINKSLGSRPYLKCEITHGTADDCKDSISSIVGVLGEPVKNKNTFEMPNFTNKIIVSREYQSKRSSRVFEMRELEDGRSYMLCSFDHGNSSLPGTEMNRITDSQIHPGSLITILDETLGWSGFLSVWQGGVTVSLVCHLLRPVHPDENFFAVGMCDSVYGNFKRKMIRCSGGIFSIKGGTYEPLIYTYGKWLTNPGFKDKMIKYILDENS